MSVGQLQPPAEDPLIGTIISDRYRMIRKLGEGGMGAVYLAEHVLIEKKVALKVLAPDLARRPDLAARFLQEAKSASRIGQENVIDISDFGQSPEGYVYIAMEFLDGADLAHAVRDGAMPWSRAKNIVLQICKALRAAHAQGIVHRDMKPENVYLIQKEGRPDFVKLLDFGIAKVMGVSENTPRLTRTGMIFGTPEYMAPEQAEGKEADHRVDIYALGCLIYHLLTGQTPFQAESFMAVLTKHLLEEAVPPSARRPDLGIDPELDVLVGKALEKDRGKRWQNMNEFMNAVMATKLGSSVPPQQDVSPPQRGSATKHMGGSAAAPAAPAAATPPKLRHAPTQVFLRDSAEQALEAAHDALPRGLSAGTAPGKTTLIVAGIVAGVVAIVAVLVMRRPAPPSGDAAASRVEPAVQVPLAAPVPPPMPAAPAPEAALQEEKSAPAVAPAAHDRRKATYRRIVLPQENDSPPPAPPAWTVPPAPRPPLPPSVPAELKPFPK